MKLATDAISVENFSQKKVILADLTAYLLAFTLFFKISFLKFANMIDKKSQFVLKFSETEISVLRSNRNVVVKESKDLLKSLTETHWKHSRIESTLILERVLRWMTSDTYLVISYFQWMQYITITTILNRIAMTCMLVENWSFKAFRFRWYSCSTLLWCANSNEHSNTLDKCDIWVVNSRKVSESTATDKWGVVWLWLLERHLEFLIRHTKSSSMTGSTDVMNSSSRQQI